jgi:hypothetical protein
VGGRVIGLEGWATSFYLSGKPFHNQVGVCHVNE